MGVVRSHLTLPSFGQLFLLRNFQVALEDTFQADRTFFYKRPETTGAGRGALTNKKTIERKAAAVVFFQSSTKGPRTQWGAHYRPPAVDKRTPSHTEAPPTHRPGIAAGKERLEHPTGPDAGYLLVSAFSVPDGFSSVPWKHNSAAAAETALRTWRQRKALQSAQQPAASSRRRARHWAPAPRAAA